MTHQESFKKRIRARMQTTGEKYNAARRALIEQAERQRATDGGDRAWAAQPEHSDAAVRGATGRGWDQWVDLIEAEPVAQQGHTAVAAWVREEHGIDGWWAQSVTGGWERITGRRLPHQMADGTFTANRSRTMALDAAAVRALLVDEEGRDVLFPTHDTVLRSNPASKTLRVEVGPGVAVLSLEERGDGRVTVTVAHEQLPHHEDVKLWKQFWSDWLDALAGAS